jgi:putative tributyrin esterase
MELINRLCADPSRPKPRLFACCGKQDSLYADNVAFRDFMKDKPFDFTFEDGDGVHNWAFWDQWVVRALDFFLEK